jgi:hypothetical protein
MLSVDTNILIYAANPESENHKEAVEFLEWASSSGDHQYATSELVLVELYMQLRNPRIFAAPLTPSEANSYCQTLRSQPNWRHLDYQPIVADKLWDWASKTNGGFREIIDARLALSLRHHGVTRFATANVKHFQNFGFTEVWNPLLP